MNYLDYLRKHIFEPAGMDTAARETVNSIIPHRTQGYIKLPNGELANSGLAGMSIKTATTATLVDLARFAIAYLSGKLARRRTAAEMFAVDPTQRQTASGPMGYGVNRDAPRMPTRCRHAVQSRDRPAYRRFARDVVDIVAVPLNHALRTP